MPQTEGLLAVISGPAGSGKTTLVNTFLQGPRGSGARRAVTATTRPPRPGERDGVDYYFYTPREFEHMAACGEFLEYTRFNGNYYGSPRRQTAEDLARGGVVFLVIEVEGARAVRRFFTNAVFVFVVPPTPEALRQRLTGRGTETAADIENRLAIARNEAECMGDYDFLVINDDITAAVRDLETILDVSRRSLVYGTELAQWQSGAFAGWANR